MRIVIISLLALLFTCKISAQTEVLEKNKEAFFDINTGDTVTFDLVGATLFSNNRLAIPIIINTDDKINSLDFSMKFNEQVFKFDTIIKNSSDVEMTYFLNPNDRKLRLTSFSLNNYKTDKKFATLYVYLIASKAKETDLYDILTFLNGDGCTAHITKRSFINTSTSDVDESSKLNLYPNPSTYLINVECEDKSSISITNLEGKRFYYLDKSGKNEVIDIQNFQNGTYLLKIKSNGKISSKNFLKL